MGICTQCGNHYDKTFEITKDGATYVFDSFECAIAALAPTCPQCSVRIVGHGVEQNGTIFCCANCAKRQGVTGLVDRD
jgi:hypothetical protein